MTETVDTKESSGYYCRENDREFNRANLRIVICLTSTDEDSKKNITKSQNIKKDLNSIDLGKS